VRKGGVEIELLDLDRRAFQSSSTELFGAPGLVEAAKLTSFYHGSSVST